MAHVFDMQTHKVMIVGETPEWEERFPVRGEKEERQRGILAMVYAWREGQGPNRSQDMPMVLVIPKNRKPFPDAFKSRSGIHVVSAAAKEVIEELDPGVHQFFPLRVETPKGVEIEGPWFIMNVHFRQESIDMEKSRFKRHKKIQKLKIGFILQPKPKISSLTSYDKQMRIFGGKNDLMAACWPQTRLSKIWKREICAFPLNKNHKHSSTLNYRRILS